MNTFENRKLLVVGGTSGVGLETAKLVLEQSIVDYRYNLECGRRCNDTPY